MAKYEKQIKYNFVAPLREKNVGMKESLKLSTKNIELVVKLDLNPSTENWSYRLIILKFEVKRNITNS